MSKSLGNFFTVRDLLDKGYPGEVIRMVYLGTHYSKPMDWTEEKAAQAEATLRKWRALVAGIEPAPTAAPSVVAALADDLNTAGAIAALHVLAGQGDAAGLKTSAGLLGVLEDELGRWAQPAITASMNAVEAGDTIFATATVGQPRDLRILASRLVQLRETAVETKSFGPVDALKAALIAAGVEVRMSKGGVELVPGPGFDPAKLGALT